MTNSDKVRRLRGSRGRTAPRLVAGTIAFAVAIAACGSAEGGEASSEGVAESVVLRFASPLAEGAPGGVPGVAGDWWMDEITARSDGAITFDFYPAATLMPSTEIVPAVSDGRIDGGFAYDVINPDLLPMLSVSGIPFVTEDSEAVARTFAELSETSDLLRSDFDALGVQPLTFTPTGAALLATSTPVESLEDLAGLRLRASGNIPTILGVVDAEGTFLDIAETYEGIQRGVVDGLLGADFYASAGLSIFEVAPHWTSTGVGNFSIGVTIINNQTWENLSDEHQQIIEEVSAEYIGRSVEAAAELGEDGCTSLLEAGGTVSALPDADTEEWSVLVGTAVNEQLEARNAENGVAPADFQAFVEEFQTTLRTHEGEGTYVDPLRACAEQS